MMTNPKQKLAELKAKAEAATRGKWLVGYGDGSGASEDDGYTITAAEYTVVMSGNSCGLIYGIRRKDDAAFIAACDPQTILDLISRVEASPAIPSGDQWRFDMDAVPASDDREQPILIAVKRHDGWRGVGEARFYADKPEGSRWWWAGETDGEYHDEAIDIDGVPYAWRPLPASPDAIESGDFLRTGGGAT